MDIHRLDILNHVIVFIKLRYNHCFDCQGGSAERWGRGPEAPKVANILRGSSRCGGQEGQEWWPGSRAKPPPPLSDCVIKMMQAAEGGM